MKQNTECQKIVVVRNGQAANAKNAPTTPTLVVCIRHEVDLDLMQNICQMMNSWVSVDLRLAASVRSMRSPMGFCVDYMAQEFTAPPDDRTAVNTESVFRNIVCTADDVEWFAAPYPNL